MALGFFPALFDNPQNIKFFQTEQNETLNLVMREHFITNIPWLITSFLALVLPVIIVIFDQMLNLNLIIKIPLTIFIEAIILWYVFVTAYVLENLLFWYFNIYIVTNIRLIDVNFISPLQRDITENRLDEIESVTFNNSGILQEVFNFGDVTIETAAKDQSIQFFKVPKPDFVANRIESLQQSQESSEKPTIQVNSIPFQSSSQITTNPPSGGQNAS